MVGIATLEAHHKSIVARAVHDSGNMREVGKTTDGRLVVAEVYRFRETHGLPLEFIAEALLSQGIVVSWKHYLLEAIDAGMKPSRILAEISSVLSDIYKLSESETLLNGLVTSCLG